MERTAAAASSVRVAIVQTVRSASLAETLDEMLVWIEKAAARGARVVVFAEGALGGAHPSAALDAAAAALRSAARQHEIYVITGVFGPSARARRWLNWLRPQHWVEWYRSRHRVNWMVVVGPDGRELFRYDKLYNQPDAAMPGVFHIDGIPCSAIICADRWLRGIEEIPIQQGAQVCFELSNNFPAEWVPAFGWYWYVPRALRNNVWVIVANRARRRQGRGDDARTGHGHSALIAPDGTVVACAGEDEEMLVADLDVRKATRAAAVERAAHPVLEEFWSAGDAIQRGRGANAPRLKRLRSPKVNITLAAAPVAPNATDVRSRIAAARSRGADLVAFPARTVDEAEIEDVRSAAREHEITVAIGATRRDGGDVFNTAFVIGPDGSVLTRHDQLSSESPLRAGADLATMWFSVKGVPAVVILERDALWTEIAEMAAVAGARIVVHLDHANEPSDEARQTRLQIWSNVASFLTLTASVGVGDACLWDNLRGMEHVRAALGRRKRPHTGAVAVYSAWSAHLVARTSSPSELLVVTRTIPSATNPHYPLQTARYNPQMDAWYRLGAHLALGRQRD